MREIIRDQFATSMNEFMANMNSGVGGPGGASGSGGVGMDIDGFTNRFHELALLCPRMMEPEAVKVEQYI
nr:hypothetical protein [Tanacetum cinerariifolium]